MSSLQRPPQLAVRFLSWVLPERLRESILGDMEEEMPSGKRMRIQFWMQTLELTLSFIVNRIVRRMANCFEKYRLPGQQEPQGDGWMENFWNDIRYGARMLIKAPLFTIVCVFTLALGLGATTAIFSIVNALLLQPLPLPNAEQMVAVIGVDQQGRRQYLSFPDFEDLTKRAQSFDGFSAFIPQSVNFTGHRDPQRLRGGFVSDNFFHLMGIQPAFGRTFFPGKDDREGADRVCILQHETWQNSFQGNPNLLGKTIQLNNEPFTIIGILPKGFRFPFDEVEVWIPHHHSPPFKGAKEAGLLQSRSEGMVGPFGAIKRGVSFEQAASEVKSIFQRLSKQYPDAGVRSANMQTLRELVVGDARQIILILLGAVIFVLMIACTNVANLILSRATVRRREMATRAALGAGRTRLMAQLFTETGLLWIAGGLAGLLVGWWGLSLLLAAAPDDLPGGIVARFDLTVFLFAAGFTTVTAIFFGMIPALRVSLPGEFHVMRDSGTKIVGSRTRGRTALVIGQVALTLILLTGSVLMLRSLQQLIHVKVGFESNNLLSMEYRLPRNKYPEPSQLLDVHTRIIEEIRRLPGVQSAALIGGLPFSGNGAMGSFEIVGRPPEREAIRTRFNLCGVDYFRTMRIPVIRGRSFQSQDRDGAPIVAVINQYLAERFWPKQDPIGQQIQILFDGQKIPAEIIGVVGNTKQYNLDDPEIGYIYGAQAQNPNIFNTIVVRTSGDPMQMATAVRSAVWSVDPDQPVWKIRTVDSLIQKSLGLPRFLTQLLSGYALIALLLAAIGIYGTMSYSVSRRTGEIGLRMALGAQRTDVLRLILKYGITVTMIGVAIGLAGALSLGRVLKSVLFQTSASDPLTLGFVTLLLAMIALFASYLPARRAARMDPLASLRYE